MLLAGAEPDGVVNPTKTGTAAGIGLEEAKNLNPRRSAGELRAEAVRHNPLDARRSHDAHAHEDSATFNMR